MILLILLAVTALFLLIGTGLHMSYFQRKKAKIHQYGQMVEVFDGQMHLYRIGQGDTTIVLLPGLGVSLPSADFGPLMRSLSEHYTVVCLEYFGVGFSTQTNRKRTCENYVEEIRAALLKSGLDGPYVLMPHSVSSLFSEFYATKHPDEIKAIISLDGTSSAYIGDDMPIFVKSILGIAKFQQFTGLTSLLAPLSVKRAEIYDYGYRKKELDDLITFAGFSMNDNVLEQMCNVTEFVKDTNKKSYPLGIPYFKIISQQTYYSKNSQIKISPEEYQQQHLLRVGAESNFKILKGNHFIYQNNAEAIKNVTIDFL